MAYDLLRGRVQRANHVLLAAAQRRLVGQLIEMSPRLAALAVQAADGQPQLGHRLHHRAHLAARGQRRQMQHHRAAHARARVGRTRRQEAQLAVEGEGVFLPHRLVQIQRHLRRALQLKPGQQALEADVILLVEHDRHCARRRNHRRRALNVLQKIIADIVMLHQPRARVLLQLATCAAG